MRLKNHSPAAYRNRQPIFQHLTHQLNKNDSVLEIGSGSGQHALYFCEKIPSLQWQPTEQAEYLQALTQNLAQIRTANLRPPFELEVTSFSWENKQYDVVYTANTLHIMTASQVEHFLQHVKYTLKTSGKLIVYGPFKYQGKFTSDSNQEFDTFLKARNSGSCIKDYEWVNEILSSNGFALEADINMPANNQLLTWAISN